MTELKAAALAYARKGWPIFPIRDSRVPYTRTGVLSATTDTAIIEDWWTKWPTANIAMNVSEAGLVAVDLDPGSDAEALKELFGDEWDTGLVQKSPRGEHRFYYLEPGEKIKNSVGKIAPKVDIKAFHAQLTLAPSKSEHGVYSWVSEGAPTRCPQAIRNISGKVREKAKDYKDWLIEPDLPEHIRIAENWCLTKAQVAIEGQGGDIMTYRTAAMMKSYGLSIAMAKDVLCGHWNPRCKPPWDEEELEGKIANAYEYGDSAPGNMTDAYQKLKSSANLFKPVVVEHESGAHEYQAGRFRIVDEEGIDNIEPPAWLIQDAIPEGAFAMLIGPRGTMKTFAALDMALSIASGGREFWEDGNWRGPWPNIATSGPVLFVPGEGRRGVRDRISAWKDYHLEGENSGNFFMLDPVPTPRTPEDVEQFLTLARAFKEQYQMVVLDTVGRAMQGMNENAQQDASQFTEMVERIQRGLGCAVLAIHHTGHGATDRARGSSVFGADADTEFVVEKINERTVSLQNTKQKDAAEWENPKTICFVDHLNSLVATIPKGGEERQKRQIKTDGKRGQAPMDMDFIRGVAYRVVKNSPSKPWSKRALAVAIAADPEVPLAVNTIRNAYMGHMLVNKKHPIFHCYDQLAERYVYQDRAEEEGG